MIQFDLRMCFQVGWYNHQLVSVFCEPRILFKNNPNLNNNQKLIKRLQSGPQIQL